MRSDKPRESGTRVSGKAAHPARVSGKAAHPAGVSHSAGRSGDVAAKGVGSSGNLPDLAAFRILVADDEPEILANLKDLLAEEGYAVTTVGSGREALQALEASAFHLIITDMRMPEPDGLELLRIVKQRWPGTEVILLTAFASRETAREAMRDGALEYVEKPYKEFEMLMRVGRVFERQRLEQERDALTERVDALEEEIAQKGTFESLIARSPAMKEVFYLARRVAATDATVLLRGESGTGKGALARAIHLASPRRDRSFLKINCGALPDSLLESELFGHEKGAFTGAVRRKEGLFSAAASGTLFLDEIGDISPAIQLKLLQVLEEKTFLPVGGVRPITVDVRIVAATNQPLEEAIAEARFREDLFYRINVFPVTIPPLRERREDIPPLVERFLKNQGVDPGRVTREAMKALERHPLPGNVRELENILQRALIVAGEDPIEPELITRPREGKAPNP
jgi:DNA-binding NtrC family response regulator